MSEKQSPRPKIEVNKDLQKTAKNLIEAKDQMVGAYKKVRKEASATGESLAKTTKTILKNVEAAKAKEAKEPQKSHDYYFKNLRIDRARGRYELVSIMCSSISREMGKHPNLYSEKEIDEAKSALKEAIKKNPEVVIDYILSLMDIINFDNLMETKVVLQEAFKNTSLQKVISYHLRDSHIYGQDSDSVSFTELNTILDYAKKNNIQVDLKAVSKLAQRAAETNLKKAVVYGQDIDSQIFNGVKEILEETKKAGLNINLEPLNKLAKQVIERHKQKVAERPWKKEYSKEWLKELQDAAKEAGLNIH